MKWNIFTKQSLTHNLISTEFRVFNGGMRLLNFLTVQAAVLFLMNKKKRVAEALGCELIQIILNSIRMNVILI
jgi:hypothetical protein